MAEAAASTAPESKEVAAKPAKARLTQYDIARGIAMAAVIVGHTSEQGVPSCLVDFCYSFDMALFFIISGFFTHADAVLDGAYVKKCARSLLLPYLATSCILLALFVVRGLVIPGHGGGPLELLQRWSLACLYGSGTNQVLMPAGVIAVGALWYLLALFWAKLLLALANSLPFTPVVVLGLFAFGYGSVEGPWLPWSIQPACCAVLYLYIGQKIREANLFERGAVPPAAWLLAAAVWLYCAAYAGPVYMVSNYYGSGVAIDVVGGVCGALCVVKASELIARRLPRVAKPLQAFGSVTLPVFCMHLVEMDVLPWDLFVDGLAALPGPMWISALAVRCVIIACLTAGLYVLPRAVSGIFFPSRRAKKGA